MELPNLDYIKDLPQDKNEELQKAIALIKEQAENPWKNDLEKDGKGRYLTTPDNYMLFFSNYAEIKGKLRYNSLTNLYEYEGQAYNKLIEGMLINKASRLFDGRHSKTFFDSALAEYMLHHQYNPLHEYLKGLKWDGRKRAEKLFIDWLGAEDTPLNRAMTINWLTAAIKRALVPGCKFDPMIILQCEEGGGGKTTICQRLGLEFGDGQSNYYNELTSSDLDNPKTAMEKMQTAWIVVFDELDAMNKKEVSSFKTFMSQVMWKGRKAYGHDGADEQKRFCVFIGSTNETNFLRDYTGSIERRFWIIPTSTTYANNRVWKEFNRDVVNQIWAEVYQRFLADPDVSLELTTEMYNELRQVQKDYKSYNNDPDLYWFQTVLFMNNYELNEKGLIEDEKTFLNNIEEKPHATRNVSVGKIKRIPIAWVKNAAAKNHINWKSGRYYAAALGCEYKAVRYNGIFTKCLCINVQNDNDSTALFN